MCVSGGKLNNGKKSAMQMIPTSGHGTLTWMRQSKKNAYALIPRLGGAEMAAANEMNFTMKAIGAEWMNKD